MLIYIIEGTRPQYAKVEIYELDHETEHILFLKVRGSVARKAKNAWGFRWFRSEAEAAVAVREWINKEIAAHESQLELLRAMDKIEQHQVPPDRMKVQPGKILL